MKLWIARDKDALLYLYEQKPQLTRWGNWMNANSMYFAKLPMSAFPEVTFENSPQEIEIKFVSEIVGVI